MEFALLPSEPQFERFCDAGGFVVDPRFQGLSLDFFRAMDMGGCDLALVASLLKREPLLGRVRFLPDNDLQGSALHLAAARGDVALTRALLPFSDATATEDLNTPFDLALSMGHDAVAELIFPFLPANFLNCDKRNPSLMASAAGAITLLRETLKTCDPRRIDDEGRDALMCAAETGRFDCVAILLDRCDPRSVDFVGFSALDHAIRNAQADVARLLLPRSDPKAGLRSRFGRDSLMLAASESAHEIIPMLLPVCDLSQRSMDGKTAFDIALDLAERAPQTVDAFHDALSPLDLRRAMEAAQDSQLELPRIRARFEAMELGDALAETAASPNASGVEGGFGASGENRARDPSLAAAPRKPRAL